MLPSSWTWPNSWRRQVTRTRLGRRGCPVFRERFERRFSGLIRLESGWTKSYRKEKRRGETISHRGEEGHPGVGQFSGEERTGLAADAGVDRAVAGGGRRTDRRGGAGDDRGGAALIGRAGGGAAASGEKRRSHRLAWWGARDDVPERTEAAGEAAALAQEGGEGRG